MTSAGPCRCWSPNTAGAQSGRGRGWLSVTAACSTWARSRRSARPDELADHIRAAITNGVTQDEVRECLLQVAVYAGMPAGPSSFKVTRKVLEELGLCAHRHPPLEVDRMPMPRADGWAGP